MRTAMMAWAAVAAMTLGAWVVFPRPERPGAVLLGAASVKWDATDKSGLDGSIPGTDIPRNRLAAFGSGLAYTGQGDEYVAITDRGPLDGAADYDVRFHRLTITAEPGGRVRVELVATMLLHDPDGRRYFGQVTPAAAEGDPTDRRLDPEAIAVSPAGTLFTGDEYGPWIDEWSMDGTHLRRLSPPAEYRPPPNRTPPTEPRLAARSGRQDNRGFEGLAVSPDGAALFVMTQSPLLQDGALDLRGKRVGTNLRLLRLDLRGGAPREYLYPLDGSRHGVNEVTAVSTHSVLVLERDGKEGGRAKARRIYLADFLAASDVSGVAALPSSGAPPGVEPVRKTLVLDLLDPAFGLAGDAMPEKIEGMALGPALSDGRKLLLIASDNDFRAGQPTRIWAFALPDALLGDVTSGNGGAAK